MEWEIDALITCYANSSVGNFWGQGFAKYAATADTTDLVPMCTTAKVDLDVNRDMTLDVTAQWNSSSGTNSLVCTNLLVEVKN